MWRRARPSVMAQTCYPPSSTSRPRTGAVVRLGTPHAGPQGYLPRPAAALIPQLFPRTPQRLRVSPRVYGGVAAMDVCATTRAHLHSMSTGAQVPGKGATGLGRRHVVQTKHPV